MEFKEKRRSEGLESHRFLLASFVESQTHAKSRPFSLEKFVDYLGFSVRVEGLPCSCGKVRERQFLMERALLINVLVMSITMKIVQIRNISVFWARILCTWQKWAHILQPATEPRKTDVLVQCLKTHSWKAKAFPRSPLHIDNKAACYFQGIVTRNNFCRTMLLTKSKLPAEKIYYKGGNQPNLTLWWGVWETSPCPNQPHANIRIRVYLKNWGEREVTQE